MSERRIDDLLTYLHALTRLYENEYRCYEEINECITMIRSELGVAHV